MGSAGNKTKKSRILLRFFEVTLIQKTSCKLSELFIPLRNLYRAKMQTFIEHDLKIYHKIHFQKERRRNNFAEM